MRKIILILLFALLLPAGYAADWNDLLRNGLADWKILGEGIWRLRSDGVVTAYFPSREKQWWGDRQSIPTKELVERSTQQSWLYTRSDYAEFDLHLEYWVNTPGNSGISIRDPSQAKWGISSPPDFTKTPSKLGYEIQINSEYSDRWSTGSIYGFARAREGLQVVGEWNSLNIESREDAIRVYVNGVMASEHTGDPKRPKTGPIGLQLHDMHSFVMFRNIWILEY